MQYWCVPCKYPGLQLAIMPLTKAKWQPVLDRARRFVPVWQRGLIKRHGHLVLAKSVTSANPTHHLMDSDVPDWVFGDIDRWTRSFFWAGKDKSNGAQCLVAWNSV